MSGEWVRSTWDFSPVALSHTGSTIVKAFHSLLTQCGWESAPFSTLTDERYYMRSDRATLLLTNKTNGTAGNVAITASGAHLVVTGMSGGSSTTPATGTIQVGVGPTATQAGSSNANVTDGEFVTISDGTLTKTFEFDSNSSVTGSNIAVTIQPTRTRTMEALKVAINASGLNITAAPLTLRWRFNGDGTEVDGGIHIKWDTGNSRVFIRTFVDDGTSSSAQYETSSTYDILITYNLTVVNSFLLFAGEDGLFLECGSPGASTPVNIAHGAIKTMAPIPEMRGTKDDKMQWTAQGLVCNMFGNLVYCPNRTYGFVLNDGTSRVLSVGLAPPSPRGTTSVLSYSGSTSVTTPIGARDNFIGLIDSNSSWGITAIPSYGLLNSPVDDSYKLSPLWARQGTQVVSFFATSLATNATTGTAANNAALYAEPRWLRYIPRFMACDQTMLPWNNITDPFTSLVYRITQIQDGGRQTNLAVEYPTTAITIPTTPAT